MSAVTRGYRRFYCSFIKAMKLFFYRSSVSYVTHMYCGCVLVTFGVGLGTYDASRRRRLRVVTKSGFGREYLPNRQSVVGGASKIDLSIYLLGPPVE